MKVRLSLEDARRMRRMKQEGVSVRDIAEYFGASIRWTREILAGDAYKDNGDEVLKEFTELHGLDEDAESLMERLTKKAQEVPSETARQYEVSEDIRKLAEELSGKKVD